MEEEILEKETLEIELVSGKSEIVVNCGPDTCPWIDCSTPSNH